MKTLTEIYSDYLDANKNAFGSQNILKVFWTNKQKYKIDLLQMLDTAITDQDQTKLQFCIAASFRDGLDKDYSDRFYKIILETWHNEYEDIIDNISELKDEKFIEPLYEIAMNSDKYRIFDDENESTLRKCVHALKAINTKRSLDILNKLIETKNPNIQHALDNYK